MKRLFLLILILALSLTVSMAQDDSDDSAPTSTVNWLFSICENQAVIDLTGEMQSGYDLYIQVFRELGATGQPLTGLVRVPVDGTYQVSQTLAYTANGPVNLGQFGSMTVAIARENDATSSIYSTTFDDVYDTCITPQYPSVDTTDAGTVTSGTTGTVTVNGVVTSVVSSGIYKPDGTFLNEVIVIEDEPLVQIGARPSLAPEREFNRTTDPGIVFAECNDFPAADPGNIWDLDNVTIYWSWYAATPELVQQHLDNALYEVFLSSEYAWRQPFPDVTISPIRQLDDGNYWVFFSANLGDGFRPGQYIVDYYVTWSEPISDGFQEFGPGTENPFFISRCTFDVVPNPYGTSVPLPNPTVPLQQGF